MSLMKVKSRGDFKNTETFLLNHKISYFTDKQLEDIAVKSVSIFKKNTPSKSGLTADSWSYEIDNSKNKQAIIIHNSNIQNGYNIAIIIDEGHATPSGKWVAGKHFIDKSIKEIVNYINSIEN